MSGFFEIQGIHQETLPSGSRILHCEHDGFRARLSLEGGHLLDFTPTGQRPWLYLSPLATLEPGKAIRGGIPVCWPWFGPHAAAADAPQHGVARTAPWQIAAMRRTADGFSIRLDGPEHDGLQASLVLELGPALELSLTTRNASGAPRTLGAALHTYLALGDARHAEVGGLAGTPYDDKVQPGRACHDTDRLACAGEIDRIVYTGAALDLIDPVWGRRLRVHHRHAGSAVLWNPGADKAARLQDLPDEGWTGFFCIEAALAGEETRVLAPGDTLTFGTRIESIPL